jgi:hypothetical protein
VTLPVPFLSDDLAIPRAECLTRNRTASPSTPGVSGRHLFVVLMLEAWTRDASRRARYCAGPYKVSRVAQTWRLQYRLGRTWVTQSTGDASQIYDVARRTVLGALCRDADTIWML